MAGSSSVSYSDETTINKVYTALNGNNDLDFQQCLAAVSRLQAAGILFREEVPEHLRPSRRTRAELAAAGELPAGDGNSTETTSVPDGSL